MVQVVVPGFDQGHRDVRVLAEAGGDDGAGRPASHDDVVVFGDQVLRHGLVEHAVLLLLSAGHGSGHFCGNQPVTAGSVFW